MLLMTKKEFAKVARVKDRTIDSWIQRGLIKPVKAGPRLNRFLIRDVEIFLRIRPGTLRPEVANPTIR